MVKSIRSSDITTLISTFTRVSDGRADIININPKVLSEPLKNIGLTPCFINIDSNVSSLEYAQKLKDSRCNEIKCCILYAMPCVDFKYVLNIASIMYNKKIEYIILTKKRKYDTKNFKAFLVFYNPYRIFGNALLLRRHA